MCPGCLKEYSSKHKHPSEPDNSTHEQFNSIMKLLNEMNGKMKDCATKQEVDAMEGRLMAENEETKRQTERNIQEAVDKLDLRLKKLEEKDISTQGNHVNPHPDASTIAGLVKEQIMEVKEIEIRKQNLIIFGVPEQPDQENNSKDKESIEKIGNAIGVQINQKEQLRLGQRSETNPSSRPIKIVFNDQGNRRDVLRNAWKLKNSPDTVKMGISIDFTPKRRQENKVLRERLHQMKLEGDEQHIIRNGKIVRRIPPRGDEQQSPIRPRPHTTSTPNRQGSDISEQSISTVLTSPSIHQHDPTSQSPQSQT